MIKKILITSAAFALLIAPITVSAQSTSALQSELATLEQQLNQLASQLGTANTSTSNPSTSNITTQTTATTPAVSTLPDNESNYTGTTSGANCPTLTSTLSQGQTDAQTGGQVTQLQEFLAVYFNLNPQVIVTGYFGPTTASYVAQFQSEQNLPTVGYVGSQTRAAIASVCSAATTPSSTTSFAASPSGGQAPLAVSFTASGSGINASTTVDFGDGSTSTLSTMNIGTAWGASHTYTAAGTYAARLENPYISTNGTVSGVQIIASANVIVSAAPTQSTPSIAASPSAGPAPLAVTFSGFVPAMGLTAEEAIGFYVDFGDGATSSPFGMDQSFSLSHTYAAAGAYTANLVQVSSDVLNAFFSTTSVATASVNVNTSGVSFSATPTSGLSPLTVTFSTTGGKGDSLNFGDGQTGTFSTCVTSPAVACSATHTYAQSGNYTATMEDSSNNVVGTETITVSANTSSIEMTVPGSVQLTVGQTAVQVAGSGETQPVLTLNAINSNTGSPGSAAVTVVYEWTCTSPTSSCTAAAATNATLQLNAPQEIHGVLLTLTALTANSATIQISFPNPLTFTVPGTVSFTATGQTATDAQAGDTLQLTNVNPSTLLAGVNWSTQSSNTPNALTLALGQPQTTSGGITLLLSALANGGATINVTGGNVQPDYSVTANPSSGTTPLAVSLSYSPSLQTFVSAFCEEAQGTSQYAVSVNWGDGAGPQSTAASVCNPHTYTTGGTYTIAVTISQTAQGQTTNIWSGTTQVTTTGDALTSCLLLTQNLAPGATDAATGGEVTALQQFLAQDPAIYPQGLVTGYFGPATTVAVQNYQTAEDLVSSGSPSTTGFGYVGPKTRAQMASHCPTFNVSFSAVPPSGSAPLMVTFNATGTPGTYTLALGDGNTTAMNIPVIECPSTSCTGTATTPYTYTNQGTYTATLSRMTCDGADPSTCANPTAATVGTATVTVGATSTATASATLNVTPTSGTAPLQVTFTGSVPGTSYTLNFGDGSAPARAEENIDCIQSDPNCGQNATITLNQTHTYATASSSPYIASLESGSGTVLATTSVSVTGPAGPGSCTTALPTHDMSLGNVNSDVNGDVTLLQNFLIAQGDLPSDDNTGFFGNATQAAVMEFQQAENISPVSGFVGPFTLAAMQGVCTGQKPNVSGYSFSASPSSGAVPLSTTFTLTNAETLESGVIYVVDFGDNSRAPLSATASNINILTVAHTYSQAGTFTANLLQERNLCGGLLSTPGCVADLQVGSTTVTVSAPASALSVSCSLTPSTIAPGGSVTWSATASGGAGGYTYAWSDTAGNTKNTGSTASWSQTYASAASVTGSLTVTDSSGATAKASCGTVAVAATSQTFSVGNDCDGGNYCSADQSTANELCVTKGFASASSFQSYAITQSNPNVAGPTGNQAWWNGIAWQSWWAGQCNTGGVCTPGNENMKELSQVTCTGTAPASLVGTANLPAATNLSESCVADTAQFAWTPQGTVPEWQLTLSDPGGGWYCQPGNNQLCSTMIYNTLNPTYSVSITANIPFTWSVAPEATNGATGPSMAGQPFSCNVDEAQPSDGGGGGGNS